MEHLYKPGDNCVLRGIVHDQVWLVQSVIIVSDTIDNSILLLLPGAQCAIPKEYWRWRESGNKESVERWKVARRNPLILEEFIWQKNRVLYILESGKYYSFDIFWDHESDRFNCYYVNFQTPYQRSHCGFDTLDLDLDIVIDEDNNWKWKDEDEYQAGIREGGIKKEWADGVERSKAEVLERIAERKYPIDGSWLKWQPDKTWTPPKLPKDWKKI
jgi:protein associated with RNAse G/E